MAAKCLPALIASSVWKSSSAIQTVPSEIFFAESMPLVWLDAKVEKMPLVWLDAKEVEERGSQCLDGSVPSFHYQPGSTDKWIFDVHAPDGMCTSEKDCFDKLPLHEPDRHMQPSNLLSLFANEDLHRVYLTSCDFTMFLSDKETISNHKGHKLYFRGARVFKHIIDTLSANNTMREVLMLGASGGGQSVTAGVEYFRSIMPASVTKFGIAPVDGWYGLYTENEFREAFDLMGMKRTVNQACAKKFGARDAHLCLLPANAYEHNTENMFVTQILDYTMRGNVDADTGNAWTSCFDEELSRKDKTGSRNCDEHKVELLNTYMENFTNTFKTSSKYNKKGQGVFLSTCPEHVYYLSDHFWKLKSSGSTTGEAIERWWKSLDAKAYWPCKLGSPPHFQCEPTC